MNEVKVDFEVTRKVRSVESFTMAFGSWDVVNVRTAS